MSKSVDQWIDEAPVEQKEQLVQLRKLILSIVPEAEEALKWRQPCYSRNSLFCYLQRAKKHVTLGFQKGVEMDDPDGLLLGDGKLMRHIKFSVNAEVDEALCAALIKDAVRHD